MRISGLLLAWLLLLLIPGAQGATGEVRVRLVTSEGAITLSLDGRRAPKTVTNFMRYVDDGRLNDTRFYRAARKPGNASAGFVQGGIGTDARRVLPDPLPLEPSVKTGIRHVDGAISMAHFARADSATCNFSIMVGANPSLDRDFAAFGHVIGGSDVVKRILASPSGGGDGPTRGQMIRQPVRIIRVERLTGKPQPTRYPRVWLRFKQ